MAEKLEIRILNRIKKAGRGTLFFTDSFIRYGNSDAIRKALQRLVKAGEIDRVTVGIYVRPKENPIIGKVPVSIEEIAKAIARRDRARIVPTGVYALNRLGLSSQVPMQIVILTNGAARKIKIGKSSITFKKTSPKNVLAVGEISRLAIQALRTIGQEQVSEEEIKKIQTLLAKEKKSKLEHDIRLAPTWIREIMYPVLNDKTNE